MSIALLQQVQRELRELRARVGNLPVRVAIASPKRGFFPVLLALDPATATNAGDVSTQCGFKYTLKTLDGGAVLQGAGAVAPVPTATMVPEWRLQTIGAMVSGDGKVGMAYYKADGTLALYSPAETIVGEAC